MNSVMSVMTAIESRTSVVDMYPIVLVRTDTKSLYQQLNVIRLTGALSFDRRSIRRMWVLSLVN
jgi:hypothetical protein